jgi:hypothetical protein
MTICIFVCPAGITQLSRQWRQKERRGRDPCRAGQRIGYTSENKLTAKLQGARTIVVRDLSKVRVMIVQIDTLGVGVVEGIEGLETQINSRSLRFDRK